MGNKLKMVVRFFLISGMGVGLMACTSMQERSWMIAAGMSQDEVVELMGSPAQRLPNRLMWKVPYICKQVPYYVTFQDMRVVKWGVNEWVADAASRDCARGRKEQMENLAVGMRAAETLQQTQFGTAPTQFQQRLEPLMKNCWQDSAGMHCM